LAFGRARTAAHQRSAGTTAHSGRGPSSSLTTTVRSSSTIAPVEVRWIRLKTSIGRNPGQFQSAADSAGPIGPGVRSLACYAKIPLKRAPGAARIHRRREVMSSNCSHLAGIKDVTPSALGCEECLKLGQAWFHLRVCRTCGHVGCCDQSPGQHATKHFHATRHPIIEGYDPPEGWGGAISTRCCSTSPTDRRRSAGRSRDIIDALPSVARICNPRATALDQKDLSVICRRHWHRERHVFHRIGPRDQRHRVRVLSPKRLLTPRRSSTVCRGDRTVASGALIRPPPVKAALRHARDCAGCRYLRFRFRRYRRPASRPAACVHVPRLAACLSR
jgi:hypothetical protein